MSQVEKEVRPNLVATFGLVIGLVAPIASCINPLGVLIALVGFVVSVVGLIEAASRKAGGWPAFVGLLGSLAGFVVWFMERQVEQVRQLSR